MKRKALDSTINSSPKSQRTEQSQSQQSSTLWALVLVGTKTKTDVTLFHTKEKAESRLAYSLEMWYCEFGKGTKFPYRQLQEETAIRQWIDQQFKSEQKENDENFIDFCLVPMVGLDILEAYRIPIHLLIQSPMRRQDLLIQPTEVSWFRSIYDMKRQKMAMQMKWITETFANHRDKFVDLGPIYDEMRAKWVEGADFGCYDDKKKWQRHYEHLSHEAEQEGLMTMDIESQTLKPWSLDQLDKDVEAGLLVSPPSPRRYMLTCFSLLDGKTEITSSIFDSYRDAHLSGMKYVVDISEDLMDSVDDDDTGEITERFDSLRSIYREFQQVAAGDEDRILDSENMDRFDETAVELNEEFSFEYSHDYGYKVVVVTNQ